MFPFRVLKFEATEPLNSIAINLQSARQQLHNVYELMLIDGQPGYEQVAFREHTFEELLTFLAMVPVEGITELISRLSDGIPAIKIAELYNVLCWSAENRGGIALEEIQEWFYGKQARRIEIALQVDIFPSNSMQECQRILAEIEQQHRHLKYLCQAVSKEVNHRLAEEESWAKYRRDTFEMPKEMTPSIMGIIKNIKSKR